MTHREYCIYIVTNKPNGTLYIGFTGNLPQRMYDHQEGRGSEFTKKYKLKMLVYYEVYQNVWEALEREKNMKKWKRSWKIKTIETVNPEWRDLSNEL